MRGSICLLLVCVACMACSDDHETPPPPCNAAACDIREADCQQAVQDIVQCFRGGETEMPPVDVISEDEYRVLFEGDSDDDAGVADDDGGTEPGILEGGRANIERVMQAFSLINLAPDEVELEDHSDEIFASIESSYVIDQDRVVVIDRGEPLDSNFAVSLFAHELVHGLQHREHDIEALLSERPDTLDSELAFDAIIEGEAMHFEVTISAAIAGVPPGAIDFVATYSSWLGGLYTDEYPLLSASARFPYAFGGLYMTLVRRTNGYQGVEEVFADPPRTSAEVIEMKRLTEDALERVLSLAETSVPEAPAGFDLIAVDVLGAYIYDQFMHRNELTSSLSFYFEGTNMIADRVSIFQSASGQTVLAWRLRFGEELPPSVAFVGDVRDVLDAPDDDAPEPGDDVRARVWKEDTDLMIIVGDHPLDAAWLDAALVWGPDR